MTASTMPVFHAIPLGVPFIPTLAGWLLNEEKRGGSDLSSALIFLPTVRACRALEEELFTQSGGRGLIMPRLFALGEIENAFDLQALVLPKRPLPKLLASHGMRYALINAIGVEKITKSELATLGDFCDLFAHSLADEVDWERLNQLIPSQFAQHWQHFLTDLNQLITQASQIVQTAGSPETLFRQQLLDGLIGVWEERPLSSPVVVAGSTGSVPAVARLIRCVAGQAQGRVILPGYDHTLRGEALPLTHPQAMMHRLVMESGAHVHDVPFSPNITDAKSLHERALTLQHAAFPTHTQLKNRGETLLSPPQIPRVHYGICQNTRQEIRLITYLVRETLRTPDQTVAVVLSDGDLIQDLILNLGTFGIFLANPNGIPLKTTSVASFARFILSWPLENWGIVAFLAVTKHGWAKAKLAPHEEVFKAFEKKTLRQFPAPHNIKNYIEQELVSTHLAEEKRNFFQAIKGFFMPLWHINPSTSKPLAWWVNTHMDMVKSMGEPHQGERELMELEKALLTSVAHLGALSLSLTAYAALFDEIVKNTKCKDPQPNHPRLQIWGPLEARLLHADRVIIADMNGDVWPRSPQPSRWLSERMRQELGFLPFDQTIGQSAHDFLRCFASSEVILTRAVVKSGKGTTPSPWLMRLELAMGDSFHNLQTHLNKVLHLLDHLEQNQEKSIQVEQPLPRVTQEKKPLRISATGLELLHGNPYAFYARDILKLKSHNPFGFHFTPARYGELLHRMMEKFTSGLAHEGDHKAVLLQILKREAHRVRLGQLQRLRFERTLSLIWDQWQREKSHVASSFAEVGGEQILTISGVPMTLFAKADRLDVHHEGTVSLLDYKTGHIPSKKDILSFEATQLLLEAWLVLRGGFSQIGARKPEQLTYLQGKIGASGLKHITVAGAELEEALTRFDQYLYEHLAQYLDDDFVFCFTPPSGASLDPYAHLARYDEWR